MRPVNGASRLPPSGAYAGDDVRKNVAAVTTYGRHEVPCSLAVVWRVLMTCKEWEKYDHNSRHEKFRVPFCQAWQLGSHASQAANILIWTNGRGFPKMASIHDEAEITPKPMPTVRPTLRPALRPPLRERRWLFGDEWPGTRCGARTRAGTPCKKPALSGKKRCQLHGGRAGAPFGKRNGNFKNGLWTKEAIQERKGTRSRIRALITLGRAIGMFDK